MLLLRDTPKYETLHALARQIPDLDPSAVDAFLLLMQVSNDVMDAVAAHLARHGISQGRLFVLILLLSSPDSQNSPSELAERAGVTRATMTGLIDGLVKDGFVERVDHPHDRRVWTIKLTKKAQKFMSQMMPDHCRRMAKLMDKLTKEDKKKLVELLGKISDGIPAMQQL
jgi:DNA-binding MarR family transcriptional regulator